MLNFKVDNDDFPPLDIKIVGIGDFGAGVIDVLAASSPTQAIYFSAFIQSGPHDGNPILKLAPVHQEPPDGQDSSGEDELSTLLSPDAGGSLRSVLKETDLLLLVTDPDSERASATAIALAQCAKSLKLFTLAFVGAPVEKNSKVPKPVDVAMTQLGSLVDTHFVIESNEYLDFDQASLSENLYSRNLIVDVLSSLLLMLFDRGLICVDLADLRVLFRNSGEGRLGVGHAKGSQKTEKALSKAVRQLLGEDAYLREARGMMANITGSVDVNLSDFSLAGDRLRSIAQDHQIIVSGMEVVPEFQDELKIVLLAAGSRQLKKYKPG